MLQDVTAALSDDEKTIGGLLKSLHELNLLSKFWILLDRLSENLSNFSTAVVNHLEVLRLKQTNQPANLHNKGSLISKFNIAIYAVKFFIFYYFFYGTTGLGGPRSRAIYFIDPKRVSWQILHNILLYRQLPKKSCQCLTKYVVPICSYTVSDSCRYKGILNFWYEWT